MTIPRNVEPGSARIGVRANWLTVRANCLGNYGGDVDSISEMETARPMHCHRLMKKPQGRSGGVARTLCGITPRAWVSEYLGGGKARFEWPCGYARKMWVIGGKQRRLVGEAGAAFMARRFRKENGGVHAECPRCARNVSP